jgi:hypothetical protein
MSIKGKSLSTCNQFPFPNINKPFFLNLRLSIRKRHPHTLNAMNNLAGALLRHEKNFEAEYLYRRVLEGQVHAVGSDHPDFLSTASNLEMTLLTQNKITEAEGLFRKTLNSYQ